MYKNDRHNIIYLYSMVEFIDFAPRLLFNIKGYRLFYHTVSYS